MEMKPVKVSKEKMESIKESFKWYPLEIYLEDISDLKFYGCQINKDTVLLTAVYNGDICTLCTMIKGQLVECEGIYGIDVFDNDVVNILTPVMEKNEKEIHIVDGDEMTKRQHALKDTEKITDDMILGFTVKPKIKGDINDARLETLINTVDSDGDCIVNIHEQAEEAEPFNAPIDENLKNLIRAKIIEEGETNIIPKPKMEKITKGVILTQGRDVDNNFAPKQDKKKKSSFFNEKEVVEKRKTEDDSINSNNVVRVNSNKTIIAKQLKNEKPVENNINDIMSLMPKFNSGW